MPKMHYFSNKFSKIAKQVTNFQKFSKSPLIFNFGNLKLRNVAKFCFFKLIMTKSNFKKSVKTSF